MSSTSWISIQQTMTPMRTRKMWMMWILFRRWNMPKVRNCCVSDNYIHLLSHDEKLCNLFTFLDSDTNSQKNNNEKPVIKPVPDTQCHCCAEDLKTAHNGGDFKCLNCDLSFKKKASLERHVVVIHWKCDSCTCDECGSSFRDKKALNKHRYTTHKDRKIFRYTRTVISCV